ncbi:acyl carrier protein [Thalassospira lucentensis]|uniref:acyl carrier protein n=1 Tax=Thalassospira lucentensis TaxID=168935 RepID=UPI003AA926B4
MTTKPSRANVEAFLRERIVDRTNVDEATLTPSTVLLEIGLQSIDAVLICGEVEDQFEIELDPSIMFEFKALEDVTNAIFKIAES